MKSARSPWLDALRERQELAKKLNRKRQDYLDTKSDYNMACVREESLYAKWMNSEEK